MSDAELFLINIKEYFLKKIIDLCYYIRYNHNEVIRAKGAKQ